MLTTIIHSSAFKGALSGLVAAILVDVHAFVKFQGWGDVIKYNWGVASFRWVVGIISGALTGSGYGALVG
jgi:hypothetical protein